ncbi:MAG: hypothetical protein WBS24_16925 [Terriglobales bacterium]
MRIIIIGASKGGTVLLGLFSEDRSFKIQDSAIFRPQDSFMKGIRCH